MDSTLCPPEANMYGYLGAVSALILTNVGATYGGVKSLHSSDKYRCIGLVLSGLLEVMGIFFAMVLLGNILLPQDGKPVYSLISGAAHLAAGLLCGVSNMIAGLAIGKIVSRYEDHHNRSVSATNIDKSAFCLVMEQQEGEEEVCNGLLTNRTPPPSASSSAASAGSATWYSMIFAFVLGITGFVVALILCMQTFYVCEALTEER